LLSINEIKRRLPKEFIEELYEVYTPITVDKILTGMTDDRYTTLRVNTLKYDIEKNITSVLETMINIFNNEFNTAISKVCSIYEDGRNIDSKKYITEMINQMKLESYKEVEVLLNTKKEKLEGTLEIIDFNDEGFQQYYYSLYYHDHLLQ